MEILHYNKFFDQRNGVQFAYQKKPNKYSMNPFLMKEY